MTKSIVIGADHAGFQAKEILVEHLNKEGYKVHDYGTYNEQSTDYPDYAHIVAKRVSDESDICGILICGSGQGMCMAANRWQNVRAALVYNKENAQLSRSHNNANICCIPARFLDSKQIIEYVMIWLNTSFEGGRHEKRVQKISIPS